jgi:hypothetical protein
MRLAEHWSGAFGPINIPVNHFSADGVYMQLTSGLILLLMQPLVEKE